MKEEDEEEDEEVFLLRAGKQRWRTVPGLQTGAKLWSTDSS